MACMNDCISLHVHDSSFMYICVHVCVRMYIALNDISPYIYILQEYFNSVKVVSRTNVKLTSFA